MEIESEAPTFQYTFALEDVAKQYLAEEMVEELGGEDE